MLRPGWRSCGSREGRVSPSTPGASVPAWHKMCQTSSLTHTCELRMKRPISLARCWSGSVCCLVLALAACTHDTAPVATQSGYPIPHVSAVMDVSGPGCSDRTHPSGLLIDRVETPPAWGIAVRDDGLTYFTEPNNGGVGITTTQSRVVEGF